MNYSEATQAGYTLTEAEYQAIESLIADQYAAALSDIDARLAKLYADYASAKTADDIYNWLIQFDRYGKLHADIASIYTKHSIAAGKLQAESGYLAMTNNYYRQQYTLTFAQPELTFALLPPELLDVAILGQIEAWGDLSKRAKQRYLSPQAWTPQAGSLTQLLVENRTKEIRQISTQINSGLISGKSYREVSKAVGEIIGTYSPTQTTGAIASAIRITRTEGTRALNAGSFANDLDAADMLASEGIKLTRTWHASLDSRTRPDHARMDGKKTAVDQPFKFPQGWTAWHPGAIRTGNSKLDAAENIQCRCTVITTAGDFTPTLRRGKNPVTGKTEVFSYQDFNAWAESHDLTRNKYGRLLNPAK